MSTRERWIVYPLLLLSLGIALDGKIFPTKELLSKKLTSDKILCNELQVGKLQVGQVMCSELLVSGPSGRPVVAAGANSVTRDGVIETFSAAGAPLVRLQSADGGGLVAAFGHGNNAVSMGCLGHNFGVFAELPERGLTIPLTQPLIRESNVGGDSSTQKPNKPASPSPKPATKKPAEPAKKKPADK